MLLIEGKDDPLHAMKACGGVEVWIHSYLISALYGEWSGLCSSSFTARSPWYTLNRRLGTPELLWTLWKRKKSPPPPAVKELSHFLTSYGQDYHLYSCLGYAIWYVAAIYMLSSRQGCQRSSSNLLTPNVNYSGRTAPLTSKVAFYIFIQQM